jgi:hypothetical protein
MRASLEISPAAQPILSLSAPSLAEAKLLWGPQALTIFEIQREEPELLMQQKTIMQWHPWCFWWTEGHSFGLSTPPLRPPR